MDSFKFLHGVLTQVGYRGVFAAKANSPCKFFKGHTGPDGCAIFWKSDLYQCTECVAVDLDAPQNTNRPKVVVATLHTLQAITGKTEKTQR